MSMSDNLTAEKKASRYNVTEPLRPPFSWRKAPFWFVVLLLKGVAMLPWWVFKPVAWVASKLYENIPSYRNRIALCNLKLCFPETYQTIYKKYIYSSRLGFFESLKAWCSKKNELPYYETEGLQYILEAQKKGKGVLLLIPHWVYLELAAAACAQNFPLSGLYRPMKNKDFDWMIYQHRIKHYAHLIPRDNIKSMIRALKDNQVVGYAPDQDYGIKNSCFIPFFGVPAAYLNAAYRVAKLTGCEVIPAGFYRKKFGSHYLAKYHPPLRSFHEGSEEEALIELNAWIEAEILERPQDYLWDHRRFKTRPEGEPYFYDPESRVQFSRLSEERQKQFKNNSKMVSQSGERQLSMIGVGSFLECLPPQSWWFSRILCRRAEKLLQKFSKKYPVLILKRLYLDKHQNMLARFMIHDITESWDEFKKKNPVKAKESLESWIGVHGAAGIDCRAISSQDLVVTEKGLMLRSFFYYAKNQRWFKKFSVIENDAIVARLMECDVTIS